jgi:hypothetical protein
MFGRWDYVAHNKIKGTIIEKSGITARYLFELYGCTEFKSKGKTYNIVSIDCNYGGKRYFVICPYCHKRFTRLYIVNGILKCRKCGNLNYFSQQKNKRTYILYQLDCILKELQCKASMEYYNKSGLLSPAYFMAKLKKPEKMKKTKYKKLVDKYYKLAGRLDLLEINKADEREKYRNNLIWKAEVYFLKKPSPYQSFEDPNKKYNYFSNIDGDGAI